MARNGQDPVVLSPGIRKAIEKQGDTAPLRVRRFCLFQKSSVFEAEKWYLCDFVQVMSLKRIKFMWQGHDTKSKNHAFCYGNDITFEVQKTLRLRREQET